MEPYEKIKFLRIVSEKTTYDIAESTNIPQSTISKIENNKRKLEPDILAKLSKYFNVSYNFLLNNSEIDTCPICGANYCPLEKEDFKSHEYRHNNFLNFPEKKLFIPYSDREVIKRKNHEILDSKTSTISEKVDAAINLYKCWYARSIDGCDFNIKHPLFNDYVAMMLNRKDSEKELSTEVYKILVNKYGVKKGIPDGESYYILPEIKLENRIQTLIATLNHLATDKNTLLENFDKLNDLGKSEANKRVAELTEIDKYINKTTDEISATKDNVIEFNKKDTEDVFVPYKSLDELGGCNAAHDDDLTEEEKILYDQISLDAINKEELKKFNARKKNK